MAIIKSFWFEKKKKRSKRSRRRRACKGQGDDESRRIKEKAGGERGKYGNNELFYVISFLSQWYSQWRISLWPLWSSGPI